MNCKLEDLGTQAHGDTWLNWRRIVHPKTGEELALGSLSRGGFMLIHPRERTGIQVMPDPPVGIGLEAWAVGQAPDGSIYQAYSFGSRLTPALFRWSWEGNVSRKVADLPCRTLFTLDVAPDGRVYLPEYASNTLYRYDPRSGEVEDLGKFQEFGDHIRDVRCDANGLVYVTATDYKRSSVVAFHPQTGARSVATDARVPPQTLPITFRDGRSLQLTGDTRFKLTNAGGGASEFEVKRQDSPLRIFSVATGGGKIWGGTFIPLVLFSYEPSSGQSVQYGNPTETQGEIYGAVFSEGRLFIGSYVNACLSRYTPGQPWNPGKDPSSNPRYLGRMKEDRLPLHRPHGNARDRDGNVFFAALGGYGCEDSGISRIHPRTEEVTRWIYRNTTTGAMCYLPTLDRLLVSERRTGEEAIRFTVVSPQTGEIVSSEIVIRDDGGITSWLADGDLVYGLHAYRATIFAYSLSQRQIVARLEEMRFGEHCCNMLLFGPDDRIWGLTNRCVYAVTRDLQRAKLVAEYEDRAFGNAYRFGMCVGPGGAIYFPNGTSLMRIRPERG